MAAADNSIRDILPIVNSTYDLLGLAVPFILNVKLTLQDLCRNKFSATTKFQLSTCIAGKPGCKSFPRLSHLKSTVASSQPTWRDFL